MSGVDRRTFVKQLSSAAAACSALPLDVTANTLLNGVIAWHPAPCNLCGVGCGLLIGIENGRAVAVKGDPDSPVGQGLACVKGYHSVQALYARDRLTRARVRRGDTLVDVPMTEALDLVAQQLRATISKYGKNSVGVYGSADWTVGDESAALSLFGRAIGTSQVGSDAGLAVASAKAGLETTFGRPNPIGSYDDIEHADVFVIWNQNLAETDPVLFSRLLERRRTKPGVRIIELATRTTRTSYASDRAFLYAPHGELLIANALAQEIVSKNAHNREFIERHVAVKKDKSADASWSEYVKFLAAYTPERAQQRAGLLADDVRWLASLYADPARNVMSLWGAGVNQHGSGTALNNLLYNLHLLVGKIGKAGNTALALAAQPLGSLAATAAPLTLFRGLESGDLRMLWIQGANPMVDLPNLPRYRKALRAAEPFIVVSDAYPSATTAVADVVLPAALWVERPGVLANSERRPQKFAQLIQAPAGVLSYGAQMGEVARRLGHVVSAEPARAVRRATVADLSAHADKRAWIWLRAYEPPAEAPDRGYPFWLLTGSVLEHSGTGHLTRRIPVLQRALPRAYVEINKADAAALGVRNGERVRLVSRRSSLVLEARVDYRAQPPRGQLFVPVFDEQLPVHMLTLDHACPLSGQPDPKCAVRIERVSGEAAT